jgi:uncharacterized repeat protein (TIGR01451 family)
VGTLLSAISGKFAKIIILGTMFPVIILSALNILLVAPLLPQTSFLTDQARRIAVGDDKWPAVVYSFVVFVLTGLLYDLNIPIIRIYEGYPWRKSILGVLLRGAQSWRLSRARGLSGSFPALNRELSNATDMESWKAAVTKRNGELDVFLSTNLPDDPSLLLPTRLGNAVLAFERYPFLAYGMDAIVLWPRLAGKIDAAFAGNIDEAKTAFDFMLNTSFLSVLSCLLVVGIGLGVPTPLSWPEHWRWIRCALFFGMLGFVFYTLAINRAFSWGLQVKSAFDLYRLDLLKALGYQQKPLTRQEERVVWGRICGDIQFPENKAQPLSYVDAPTRVIPFPADIRVDVKREFLPAEAYDWTLVSITLTNRDSERKVASVTVIDTVPNGFDYVQDTATPADGYNQALDVRGFAPLELLVGEIPPVGQLVVMYYMKPVPAGR